jgi:glycosyltransferase involved in cell wall biosynthesis
LATRAALEAAGLSLSCRDVPVGMETKLTSRLPWLGLELYPITLVIMSPVPYSETCYERAGLHRRPGVCRIAYWSWELDAIPPEWPSFNGLFDEIWTPTTFVAEAMRTRFSLPVFAMPHALVQISPQKISRSKFGIAEDHFVFLFMFDMCSEMNRKNPDGLIRAFRRAFQPDEKATLLIKTVRREFDRAAFAQLEALGAEANVRIIDELSSHERAAGFIAMCDCYVSLHRSEGFGLTMAEAMSLGKPVVTSGYSGNRDFMDPENSWLVDYRLVPVAPGGSIYKAGQWAEPSEEHAAECMREVFDDRAKAETRAQRGAKDVAEKLSVQAVGAQMKARLDVIARERGI